MATIRRLGLTAGASAPEVLVEEIIDAFAARFAVRSRPSQPRTRRVVPAAARPARAGRGVARGRLHRGLGRRACRIPRHLRHRRLAAPPRASPRGSRTRTSSCTRPTAPTSSRSTRSACSENDLPFFLALMEHLAARRASIARSRCATATATALRRLAGRPSRHRHFPRRHRPSGGRHAQHCGASGGAGPAARGGRAIPDAADQRARGRKAGGRLLAGGGSARRPGRAGPLRAQRGGARRHRKRTGPRACRPASSMPTSSPTTCSSSATTLSGLIDFYFACTDAFAYDLAICLNAWCFEADGSFNLTKGQCVDRRATRQCGG